MSSFGEVSFEVFCSVYDEFLVQSKGRLEISKAVDFYDLALSDMPPQMLVAAINRWVEDFSKTPEFYFYRGNFFWKIFVKNQSLCAVLIRKGTRGYSPINRTLAWPAKSVNPKKVVKNLLDIMKGHERSLLGERKAAGSAKEVRAKT